MYKSDDLGKWCHDSVSWMPPYKCWYKHNCRRRPLLLAGGSVENDWACINESKIYDGDWCRSPLTREHNSFASLSHLLKKSSPSSEFEVGDCLLKATTSSKYLFERHHKVSRKKCDYWLTLIAMLPCNPEILLHSMILNSHLSLERFSLEQILHFVLMTTVYWKLQKTKCSFPLP